jgi:hypothetical protein
MADDDVTAWSEGATAEETAWERFGPNTRDPLEQRQHGMPEDAGDRFAQYTRQASFSLKLGIREIRMLQQQPWAIVWAMTPQELGTVQKLIDKGLLDHEFGNPPKLSKIGELTLQLLIESRHIVLPEVPGPLTIEVENDS